MFKHTLFLVAMCLPLSVCAQINTERVMLMGRNALYYEDYVLSIQRFSMVINARPYLHEPYFYRALAKFYLEDFMGSEADCSESLRLNPYVANTYQLRGLCRVNMKKYAGAVADYERVVAIEPKNRAAWHNMVLCRFELSDYAAADTLVDRMMALWPRDAECRTMKAQAALYRADTVTAIAQIDSALAIDAFDAQALSLKAMICLQREQYADAEDCLTRAILQRPRAAGYYVNRALARFHQDNLRGAMDDYDMAIEIEPRSYLAHFNRGLLRAQVGDDNRAIADFDFVLTLEPDNMIALYNRALLLDQTGDYAGAIRDISTVIEAYPEFWTGYLQRAAIRRKTGDRHGAERDEFRVLQARMDAKAGLRQAQPRKTRKQSERDIDDYASLVEADAAEPEREYESAYRGRVQDRRVQLEPLPWYVLTHHSEPSPTNRYIAYYAPLEHFNSQGIVAPLQLAGSEAQLTQAQLDAHFADIARLSGLIDHGTPSAQLYAARAMAHYHVRDFEAAATDLERALTLAPQSALLHFALAQMLYREHEVAAADADVHNVTTQIGFARALDCLRRATELDPAFVYAWYAMGGIYIHQHEYALARQAYSKALNIDPRFPDAYYNRGVASLLEGNTQMGLSDLSQAGEYGIYTAYNLIKRYSKEH